MAANTLHVCEGTVADMENRPEQGLAKPGRLELPPKWQQALKEEDVEPRPPVSRRCRGRRSRGSDEGHGCRGQAGRGGARPGSQSSTATTRSSAGPARSTVKQRPCLVAVARRVCRPVTR